ncbi:TetR/AcrR family transcriptional regulator C-terminal domain-containing protein [Kitasatospora phosalacinea]|uniref:TetR/AcrR family transcriptional regulator C-terminal domain-containing protein n=1 Tax=Kitasatospora phosalacinea TaxID=2065 RepID=UPI0007C83D33|nr:TetR/AcrR family transcriptional regulator C-terminal domain-containing protein [Kitasatospora phosalacinea]
MAIEEPSQQASPDGDAPAALVWNRPARAPRRRALTVHRIVEASVALADAEGLDALSMRRVAAEVPTGTTSLYRQVASRGELLELMTDAVLGEVPPAPLTGDWRTDLHALATGQRAALLRHDWLGAVMSTRPALGPNSLRRIDRTLAAATALTRGDITLAGEAVSIIGDYVAGHAAREVAERETLRRTGTTEEQWRASLGPYLHRVIASGEYPAFTRRVVEAAERSFDELFAAGLETVLDGLAARYGN